MNKEVTNSKNHNHKPVERRLASPLDVEFYLYALLRHEDRDEEEEEFTLEDLEAYHLRTGSEGPLSQYE